MTVRNSINYDHTKNKGEVNTLPSMTVPDQSMSIKEILRRYAMGIPMDSREPLYLGEEGDGIDPRRLDLTERKEFEFQARQELAEIQERLKKKPEQTENENVLPSPSDGSEIS